MNPSSFRLESTKVLLRPLIQSDVERLVRWSNDPQLSHLTAETEPLTIEKAQDFIDTARTDKTRLWFMIIDKQSHRPVGECGLLRIFLPWKTADLTMIIAEKAFWGKGVSKEAMQLLLEIAFKDLGLHRLSIGVLDYNERAIGFYKRFGFKEEGRQKEGHFSGGRYHDFIMMSLLEDEYREVSTHFNPTSPGPSSASEKPLP